MALSPLLSRSLPLATYQRELRRAKEKSFSDLKLTNSFTDHFAALAQFTGKSMSIPLPDSVIINGCPISDPIEIANGCADHFFHLLWSPTAIMLSLRAMLTWLW